MNEEKVQKYDCCTDILDHVVLVNTFMNVILGGLITRKLEHDQSKLDPFETKYYNDYYPKLKSTVYGSDEYFQTLQKMKPAVDHHYKCNRHHPEHFQNGIEDMNLIDLCEMLCDWVASVSRKKDTSFEEEINFNIKRFDINSQLGSILINTLKTLGVMNDKN